MNHKHATVAVRLHGLFLLGLSCHARLGLFESIFMIISVKQTAKKINGPNFLIESSIINAAKLSLNSEEIIKQQKKVDLFTLNNYVLAAH